MQIALIRARAFDSYVVEKASRSQTAASSKILDVQFSFSLPFFSFCVPKTQKQLQRVHPLCIPLPISQHQTAKQDRDERY
jgi:hypothetical protein